MISNEAAAAILVEIQLDSVLSGQMASNDAVMAVRTVIEAWRRVQSKMESNLYNVVPFSDRDFPSG